MKIIKPWMTAWAAVLAVLLLLSWLPDKSRQHPSNGSEVAVFQTTPAVRVTNNNLVDVLIAAKLNERLNKAEWGSGVLSVEIMVNAANGRPSAWFQDVQKLVRTSFLQLQNVKRVLIRIVDEEPEGSSLLAAVDVRKSDSWLLQDMDALVHADPVHDVLWRERLRVSFTSAWEERFGPVSGFSANQADNESP
ncbi:hypothetical protein [Paenibacillus sp. sgz302251]|uniref:hypothetical protein n=1 Tax=Paenibacillus sp. sgz302251 TaxID=3414493 RepID=UPI003C7CAB2E